MAVSCSSVGLEAGWRIPQHLNLAGIKGGWTAGSVDLITKEVIDRRNKCEGVIRRL